MQAGNMGPRHIVILIKADSRFDAVPYIPYDTSDVHFEYHHLYFSSI